jgi:ribose transport system ATP-binding protein
LKLELKGITKRFPGVVANDGIDLTVGEGEIHALLGENGAGKTTLMNVLYGLYHADEGEILIDDQPVRFQSPADAIAAGIGMVHQHFMLVPVFTVAENAVLGIEPIKRAGLLDRAKARQEVREPSERFGLVVDPDAMVEDLPVGVQQRVEIIKALLRDARLLILDEPTAVLTPQETEDLFQIMRSLQKSGHSVLFITHKLKEVLPVADRITVLRNGRVVGTTVPGETSEQELASMMVGRSVLLRVAKGEATPGEVVLEVEGLTVLDDRAHLAVDDLSLQVRAGEIVVIAGVQGNGQTELVEALTGLVPPLAGSITLAGRRLDHASPRSVLRSGVAHVPEDRIKDGLVASFSVAENLVLNTYDTAPFARGPVMDPGAVHASAVERAREFDIRAPSVDVQVATLSGGNQQKVLFARSMACEPMVLLADEPTRGVDAGARLELYRILREVADQGRAVIVVSSDALELQGLCDRVVVFSRGQVVTTLTGNEVSEQNITGAALTAAKELRRSTNNERGRVRIRRFIKGDYAPAVILAVAVLGLALYTNSHNGFFLGKRSVDNLLLLASALALISFGQLIVLLTAGVDLSVGPLAGLTVVVLSFFAQQGQGAAELVLGLIVVTLVALTVGGTNALLIRRVKLSPVLATLAMYIVLQGVSLQLRSQPGGSFSIGFTNALTSSIGAVPVAFIVCVCLAIVAELGLRRTRGGLTLRAVGSDEERARRLGTRIGLVIGAAYAGCALFTMLGGLMLSSQLGVGDPSAGINYTLTSITAVVLGGASIFGGRGSFLGALLGALLLQEIASASPFLGLGQAWQYWLPGLLILAAAGLYSRARGVRLAGAS